MLSSLVVRVLGTRIICPTNGDTAQLFLDFAYDTRVPKH